jgi:hypothetical protein
MNRRTFVLEAALSAQEVLEPAWRTVFCIRPFARKHRDNSFLNQI